MKSTQPPILLLFGDPLLIADVISVCSLAGQGGIATIACPGDVVAAEHHGVRRGEQCVDVEGRSAALEQQMRQDWTDGDDSDETRQENVTLQKNQKSKVLIEPR